MINIYGIVQGPHQQPDMDESIFCMIVIALVDGEMRYDLELYSDDFPFLYEIQKHCDESVEPYQLEFDLKDIEDYE